MPRIDRSSMQPCRCELLQSALEGVGWPMFSLEQLLDRISEPAASGSQMGRDPETNKGKIR